MVLLVLPLKGRHTDLSLRRFMLNFSHASGEVAQLVEQRTENPCVGGSIPPLTTLEKARKLNVFWPFLMRCRCEAHTI